MGKKIRYHSFDFDGSLSNEAFSVELENIGPEWKEHATLEEANQGLLRANEAFLQNIIDTRGDCEDYVLVGSNRQDIVMDFTNGVPGKIPSGSVFPRIQAIAEQLGANLDKFLLSDLISGKDFGAEYDVIMNSGMLKPNGSYTDDVTWSNLDKDARFTKTTDDQSKASLLFAQMQKASMDHPDDDIEFNFHDDRIDIVEGLQSFFEEYPDLIPKNVTLNLQGYSGPKPAISDKPQRHDNNYPFGAVQLIKRIQGKGTIPMNTDEWKGLFDGMRIIALNENKSERSHINVAKDYTPLKLLNAYSKQTSSLDQVPTLVQQHITAHLVKINVEKRQDFINEPLANKLIAKEVGHSKAIGRNYHAITVTAKGKNIKAELQDLKGDHLKREILLDFKNQIKNIATRDDLKQFEANYKKTDEYKILAKSQGGTTKMFRLDTDSVKALKAMIEDKKESFNESPKPS